MNILSPTSSLPLLVDLVVLSSLPKVSHWEKGEDGLRCSFIANWGININLETPLQRVTCLLLGKATLGNIT